MALYEAATRAAFLRGGSESLENVTCNCDASDAERASAFLDKSIARSANETRLNLLRPASRIRFPADAVITVSTRFLLSPEMLRSEKQTSEHRGPSVAGVQVAFVKPTSIAKSLVTCDATRRAAAWSQIHHAGEDVTQTMAASAETEKVRIFMNCPTWALSAPQP
jgi:hypothetical protein